MNVMRCNIKAVLMTSVTGVFILGTAPAQAQLTYNQVTTYSYAMPDAEPTVERGRKTLVSTSCGGGGGVGTVGPSWGVANGASGDTSGSYSDTNGDGYTDGFSGTGVGSPDSYGGYSTASPGESSGGGESVLCTYFYKKGMLPAFIYAADSDYAQTRASIAACNGYHAWAVPMVRHLQSGHHPYLERFLYLGVRSWAFEMAYQMGVIDHSNFTGRWMRRIGEPLCALIGCFSKGKNYQALWA